MRIKMIPKSNYYVMDGVGTIITMRLFNAYHSPNDAERFLKWMRGQTCVSYNGEVGIYSWDYERWLTQGKKVSQGEDWD